MIIDWFYDDDDFTIPKLYERTRGFLKAHHHGKYKD
jgi:hypothetical protein